MVRAVLSGTDADRVVFSVVFVCTGNRARSALAEALLRAKVDADTVRVESYGTLDLGPEPATLEAIAVASKLGIDIRGHRARSLPGHRLDAADLVVGFELFHVATAVVEAGASWERAFLIRELAGLLAEAVPATGLAEPDPRATVAAAHARRSARPRSSLSIPDPFGKSRKVYAEIAGTIDSLTTTLATTLFESSNQN